jgi:hypothetical protein
VDPLFGNSSGLDLISDQATLADAFPDEEPTQDFHGHQGIDRGFLNTELNDRH